METIEKGHLTWESLYEQWLSERKPGWVAGRDGMTYQVLQPEEGVVKFRPRGAFDELYGTTSARGLTHGK